MSSSREEVRYSAVLAVKECRGDIAAASKKIGKPKKFVQTWFSRYQSTGGVSDLPRSGRPHVLSKESQRLARKHITSRRSSSCRKVAAVLKCQNDVSRSPSAATVWRALHKGRKRMVYAPIVKCKQLPQNTMVKRLQFCRKNRDRKWSNVMVIDSKVFYMDSSSNARVWHYSGNKASVLAVKDKRKIHVHGAACQKGKAPLHVVTGTSGLAKRFYSKQGKVLDGVGHREFIHLLRKTILPAGRDLFDDQPFTLLMDKAPAHTPIDVRHWLGNRYADVDVLEGWPGNSPDLNWIES